MKKRFQELGIEIYNPAQTSWSPCRDATLPELHRRKPDGRPAGAMSGRD